MKFLGLILAVSSVALAQTSTTVVNLGTTPATSFINSLGTNTGDSHEEYIAAAAMGMKVVRIGCSAWGSTSAGNGVEGQSAPPSNTSTGYALSTACINDITWSAQNGLIPELEALYNPPFHQILNLTVTSTVAAGNPIPITFTSGVGGDTLASINPPYDYIQQTSGSNIFSNYSYAGGLICSYSAITSTTGTVTPCSNLNQTLTAGTTLKINEMLYPSPITGVYASEPSLQAYVAYARYVYNAANAITTAINPAIHPKVGIWNEPPWQPECWDNRTDCYDSNPGLSGNIGYNTPNFGMLDGLQQSSSGDFIWDGTDKTGTQAALLSGMVNQTGHTLNQPTTFVNAESYHPYGNNPEDALYSYPALVAGTSANFFSFSTSNEYLPMQTTVNAQNAHGPTYGIQHVITESGASTYSRGNVATEVQKARFNMRQWWGYGAALGGPPPYQWFFAFYRLYDSTDLGNSTASSSITLTTGGTPCGTSCSGSDGYTLLSSGASMQGSITDVAPIAHATVETITTPTIVSYSGAYPLAVSALAGATTGAAHNSYILTAWQTTNTGSTSACPYPHTTACWYQVASPTPGPVVVNVPSGYTAAGMDTITRSAVTPTISGSQATFQVSDNPVEMIFMPALAGGNVQIQGGVKLSGTIVTQ